MRYEGFSTALVYTATAYCHRQAPTAHAQIVPRDPVRPHLAICACAASGTVYGDATINLYYDAQYTETGFAVRFTS